MMTTIEQLARKPGADRLHLQLPNNLRELKQKVVTAEAVSFDFFDTLFVRSLLDPEDVFDILGKRFGLNNFRDIRREAQSKAFRRMKEMGRREITLQDIYDCFDRLVVPAEELMLAEYELELALVHPNSELIDLFKEVVASGKLVVVTSDMYLPAKFFREAFRQHGLPIVPMFISADRNATKRDHGELFDILASELGISHGRILHVGDNALSDIKQAKAKGLTTYHYSECRRPPEIRHPAIECSLARGLLRKHATQFSSDSAHELGFLYGGPAAVAFLDWIAEQARCDKIDRILFLARDGYSLNNIAKAYVNNALPEFDYFLGSRIAFTLAAITDTNFHEFIPFLLSGAEGLSPYELLERIGVTPPENGVMEKFGLSADVTVTHSRREQLEEFLYAYRWEILKICRRNRRALFVYLNELGIEPGTRVALVDVGWSGTTQDAFELAIQNLMNMEVFGYYFCLADTPERIMRQQTRRMSALISSSSTLPALIKNIHRNRAGVELFFSAPHQSVIGLTVSPNGVVEAIEDSGGGEASVLARISADIASGMENFADSFERLRKQAQLPTSPLDLVMPLIEFVTNEDWKTHKVIALAKNFDNWSRTRNRETALGDY